MTEPQTASRWAIVADDLSGALDAGSRFVRYGFPVRLVFDRRSRLLADDGVLVLSTDSRGDSTATASRKVRQAIESLGRCQRSIIFKKIDSTCQGNLVSEVETALDALQMDKAILCPANLDQGRLVRNGRLLVHGKVTVDLRELLGQQGCLDPPLVGTPVTSAELKRALTHRGIVLVDAGNLADLEHLARLLLSPAQSVLLVGSAGLAGEIAKVLATAQPPQPRFEWQGFDPRSAAITRNAAEAPVLLFVGSRNPVTQDQVRSLVQNGRAKVFQLDHKQFASARRSVDAGHDTVIQVPLFQQSRRHVTTELQSFLGSLQKCVISGLILSGGATAQQVCRCLRPRGLSILGEIVPGVVCGGFLGGMAADALVCTKPGGFGKTDSLIHTCQSLRRLARGESIPSHSVV